MSKGETILGLDLGPSSIGWALIGCDEEGEPNRLVDAGVRVFSEGVEAKTNESKNVARRKARAARRLHQRRNRRRYALKEILQKAALLPPNGSFDWKVSMEHNPYVLRAKGLDEKLSPYELGRAVYHIGQRRGFKSNRKADRAADEKEKGAVKEGINSLEREMEKTSARTLGEYLSKLDPHQERIRNRYTDRTMYEKEFELLWETQRAHHSKALTQKVKDAAYNAIFYQRPLKVQKDLVGECEYEAGKKRSPKGNWYAQQFRLIQEVNNLEVIDTSTGEMRALTENERKELIEALQKKEKLGFDAARRLLGFVDGQKFSFEETGRTHLKGNEAEARLRKILGKRYEGLTRERRDEIIREILFVERPDVVRKHALEKWNCSEEEANKLVDCVLPAGYLHLSEKAVKKLLPFLEEGKRYMGDDEAPGAVQLAGYKRRDEKKIEERDAIRLEDVPDVRNPIVTVALHQVRKVVNTLVRDCGKPTTIRVELARDLKVPLSKRGEIQKQQNENRDRNDKARQELIKKGIPDPRGDDLLKYKLWEECEHVCPYTGRNISFNALFGPSPEFDIEHILPLPRSGDDSYMNKTLCWHEENRKNKHDKIPWEAYGHDEKRWGEILKRVGKLPPGKKRKFLMREIPEGFITRKLNDTRYISREVRGMLAPLVGALHKVQVGKGQVTAELRRLWGLNWILADSGEKTREDHRHHAVDAVVIALTSPGVLKKMSDFSQRNWDARIRDFPEPWTGFRNDVGKRIGEILVSHRARRKVSGGLHQETNYGLPGPKGEQFKDEKGQLLYSIRKELPRLSKSEFDYIADETIRQTLLAHLKQHGVVFETMNEKSSEWKIAMDPDATPAPRVPAKGGKLGPPIKRIRLHKPSSGMIILPRKGNPNDLYRAVESGNNHHIVIYEHTEGKKKGKWDGEVVSLYKAAQRVRRGEPVVQRDIGSEKKFVMSLSINDMIQIPEGEKAGCWRVQKLTTSGQVTFRRHIAATIDDNSTRLLINPDPLRAAGAVKIIIDPLGRIRRAHD